MTQGTIPSNVTKAACAFIESSSVGLGLAIDAERRFGAGRA
jgi:hypothetical protein